QIGGLPPTPICNPGRSAIEASLDPPKTNDLYFVADGTGGHTFSDSLKNHNAAVSVWRKVERERKKVAADASNAAPVAAEEGDDAIPTTGSEEQDQLRVINSAPPAKAAGAT